MPLKKRLYVCACCHLEINRDLNAAINIKSRGLVSLGYALEAPGFIRGE